jgi:hypothetical protein
MMRGPDFEEKVCDKSSLGMMPDNAGKMVQETA